MLIILLAAIVIGLSLGLLGAGGAILTVPALMVLVGLSESLAVAGALVIVAGLSSVGALSAWAKGRLHLGKLWPFALGSLPMASLGAWFSVYLPNGAQTLLLAGLMLIAAYRILQKRPQTHSKARNPIRMFFAGAGVGVLTGLVGIGGGFLIVPTLVIFAGFSLATAVANSLLLITLNALFALAGLIPSGLLTQLPWVPIGLMLLVGVVALLLAQGLQGKLNPVISQRIFASVLILMSAVLVFQ